MAKVMMMLDVDEEKIKEVSGRESLDDAISTELGWLNDSGMQVESWEVVEKEQEKQGKKIEIDLGFTKLVAEKGPDPDFPEVDIYLVDKEGAISQDLVVVGQNYHVEQGKIIQDDNIKVYVYSDKDNEDYTHAFAIDVYENEMLKEINPEKLKSYLEEDMIMEMLNGMI